jgi:hypothetical protein
MALGESFEVMGCYFGDGAGIDDAVRDLFVCDELLNPSRSFWIKLVVIVHNRTPLRFFGLMKCFPVMT